MGERGTLPAARHNAFMQRFGSVAVVGLCLVLLCTAVIMSVLRHATINNDVTE